uniref:Uncharacterized protein n=1 Tax=Romanomermis culicivorax TaxID=13658 RepID=A0A915KX47_ROMCU
MTYCYFSMGVSLFSIQLEIDDSSPHVDISMSESNDRDENPDLRGVKQNVTPTDAKKLRGKRSLKAVSVETHRRQSKFQLFNQ